MLFTPYGIKSTENRRMLTFITTLSLVCAPFGSRRLFSLCIWLYSSIYPDRCCLQQREFNFVSLKCLIIKIWSLLTQIPCAYLKRNTGAHSKLYNQENQVIAAILWCRFILLIRKSSKTFPATNFHDLTINQIKD